MKTKDIAVLGLLIALAFVLAYVENLMPLNIGIPGAKVGLANIVTVVAIYIIGYKKAACLSLVRVLLVGLTFGNMGMLMYSAAGTVVSYVAMLIGKSTKKFSITGVSVLGGVFHNVGQIMVAMVLMETKELVFYLPALIVIGTISGVVIGILSGMICSRIKVAI